MVVFIKQAQKNSYIKLLLALAKDAEIHVKRELLVRSMGGVMTEDGVSLQMYIYHVTCIISKRQVMTLVFAKFPRYIYREYFLQNH